MLESIAVYSVYPLNLTLVAPTQKFLSIVSICQLHAMQGIRYSDLFYFFTFWKICHFLSDGRFSPY